MPAVMNAANEAANLAFREGKIPFLMIEDIVIGAVYSCPFKEVKDVNDLIEANGWGTKYAEKVINGEI